jgi:hypothetical protein
VDDHVCPICGSPGVSYPKVLEDQAPVVCAGCARFVSTYGEFKRRAERTIAADPNRTRATGC